MRALAAVLGLALATSACVASAAEVAFVYVSPNTGGASGGHAGFVAGDTVYHVQTDGKGLFRLVRDSWSHFSYVYGELQNRPLSIAHVAVSDRVRSALEDRFARVYVEQDLDYVHRDERALDLEWLEAQRDGRPPPALRAAGLLSPRQSPDPHARALAARLREQLGFEILASSSIEPSARDPEELREQLALREALRALEYAYGLDPEALAVLPEELDDPLTSPEREALEALAARLERDIAELLLSKRPDRGYALLLVEGRLLAIRHSLAENHLRLLDPFDGRPQLRATASATSSAARAERLAYLAGLLRRGRAAALAPGRLDESTYNVLEEVAGVIERAARSSAGSELLEVTRQQPPVRGRSVDPGARAAFRRRAGCGPLAARERGGAAARALGLRPAAAQLHHRALRRGDGRVRLAR